MAKNFWEGDKPAGDDGDFWASDRPAAQQELPAGVTPSTAGAGRGSTGPGAYARPAPAPTVAPVPAEPSTDPMGSGDFAAAVANSGERRVSVLQDQPMDAPDPARRLSMGAGPISQETAARAELLVDGQDPGAANRPVVERAARGLQAQVDAGTRNTFGDLLERANDPTTQRLARDQTAEQFRSIGEWAVDSSTALASGAVSLAQMVPNIVAPDSALSASLAKAQQGLQDMESAPMQARRQQLAERVKSEDGFLNQYVATVSELVTNPSVAIQESLRQAAMFAGVLGAAKLGGAAAGGAVGAAERVSPTLALGEAISGGAVRTAAQAGGATAGGVAASSTMAAGDAAGATYEKLMATDDATWKSSPDFQELVAKGVPPEQAKQEIAVTKARLAALMAAPLGVLGFMGAEASFAGRAGAGAGRPMRTLATEMVTEPAEEALTTMAGNTAVQTVNPNQQITEGAGEAAGMATVTSAPFGGAAAINEMRARPPVDRSEQIKSLRSAGDKTAADLLQRRQDREMAAFTTERETEALQPFGPAVQKRYRESRAAGAMPGDAVTQIATRTTFEEAAQAAGLSEKAREAALAKAASMPPDEAPGFLQRALQVFTSKGLAQPIEGADALATTIESRRDELLDTVLAADIRPTMAVIEELENAPGDAAKPDPVAETSAPVSPEPESVADNDILVAPETDAVHQAATSPLNDLPEPTQAQKEAGNYKLGRVRIGGMDIAVENPQGSVRRGSARDGTPWETPMRDHYGYFNGTTAADGDKLDVFIKPGTAPDFDGTVFVVDQVDPGTGKFDEAKVIFGATDQADAEAIYRRNYSADWQGLGAITALPMPAFKAWATSKQTRKPLGVLPTPTNAEVAPSPAADREAAPDQTSPAAGGDAAAPANGVPTEGAAAALEADGVGEAPVVAAPPAPAAPSVSTTLRKDGTLAVKGDAAEIRQRLAKAGITNVLAMRGGVLVGKSSATKAQALLGEAVTPEPERPSSPAPKRPEAIQDLGEKIGGARKDTAESKGAKRSPPKSKDQRPAWARRFQISQIADVSGLSEGGRWVIRDLRNVDWRKQPRQVGDTFATRAEAEAAVPIAAVGLKHRVVSSGGKYEIWRDISDRKRVKVVAQQFETREEALRYMAENAVEIVETNTTFGEADLPVPENKARVGVKRREGDVQGQDFMTAFGFRGVEFGNWNNQDERQQLMNEAYDGLLDLAEVLDVPARAIGLNGDLALAFGARGQGLSGARAHYEPAKVVMNLTKMNGAGALAHEWFHALDHYFARQDGKSSSSWQVDADGTRSLKVSDNFQHEAASAGFLRSGSGVRPEVREAYTRLMETMFRKAEKYAEDTARADRFVADTREEVRKSLAALRRELAAQKDAAYYKRHNKPASTEQLAEFDGVAELIVEGIALATEWRTIEKGTGKLSGYRWTNDHLEKIGEIFKAVRGRSGFSKDNHGPIDRLRSSMNLYAARLKMLADAQASTAKTKQVPTSFAMDAKSLDQGRGTAYWTTPHEMAARAFQGFVEDRIAERGGRSPFLNYGPENAVIITPWGFSRPYPAGAERQALNRAFQKLLDIIETKETDTGVAMFARVLDEDLFRRMTTPMQRGMSVADVQKAIAPVLERWKNGPTVKVVATTADLPIAAPHDVAGFYTDGRAYLVATNIRDSESALRFLGHEAIAHHGLREMLGDAGFRQFTNQVQLALKAGNKALAAIQSEVRAAYVDTDGKFNLSPYQESDEIAAKVVEQAIDADGKFRPGFGFVKAVYAKIAEYLRGLGLTVRFTHAELQGMLVNAQRRLEAGKRTGGARTALEPVWARSEAPQISAAIVGSNLGAGTSHPKYSAAKGGDVEAAVEVARALVTDDLVAQVRKVIGDSKPKVVPVASIEAAGRNKIPLAAAVMLADRLGLATSGDIMQANRPKRTAMDGLDRIFATPEFDGPVVAGQDYLILDDTLTQGATFASLAAHIEAGGGRVVAAVALTGKQYSAKIQASADTLASLREKHGDIETDFRAATGYGFDALTESEARYLANFKPADTVRARILAERDAARHGQGQGDAGGLSDEGPAFARDATIKSPADVEAEASIDRQNPPTQGQPDLFTPSFWDVPQDTRTDKFIFEMQDGRIDLKRVQQAIAKVGGQFREQFDARLAETLYPGRVAHRAQQFLEDEAKPLLEVMARNNVPMAELSDYLHARGAEERNAQIAKVNPDMPDGGAGRNSKGVLLTNAAAREYLAAVTPARKMVLDALAKRVDAITAGTRRLLVDEGLEKAETIAAWEEAYKNYVPMFRDEAEEGRPHPTGSGMSVRGSASKRATGSTKEVTNILAHVLMQREAAITRAEKNRVAVALYGMALTNPNPDFWATIHPGMRPEAIGRELQRMGVDPTVAEAGMQGVPTIRTVDPVLNRVVDRPNPIYKSLPGAIVLKVNGDDRVLMINAQDPRGMRMAENLKNLDGLTRLDIASSAVGKTTRWLASVNTQYNPAFGLVNLTRDTLGGAINLSSTRLRGKTAKVLAMTPGAIRGIALELVGRSSGEWGKLWRQFQADGGQTGYREMFKDANDRTARLQAELKSLEKAGKLTTQKVAGKLLGALDVFNTSLENAVRLAAYREGLQEGMSRAEAARLGRELTVDFNRKGRTGRELSPLYAFFNAAVQGSARTLETLAGPAGAKIIAGGVSLGVLQAVMLLLAGYDDDEIPEFVKSRAFIIPLGKDAEGKKQFSTIPYPLGLHVLPNTGRVLAELTLSGGDDAGPKALDAVGEIASAFNPLGGGNIFTPDGFLRTIAPSVVDPIVELGANKNFAGAPIERESQGENDPRPGFQRVREATLRTATGQTYTDIARIINTMTGGNAYEKGLASPTPERVRYLAQVVGGGLLREIEKTVNTSIDAAKGQPVKSSGVPVLGRFYGEVDDANVQRSRYFDNLREIETLERKIRAADKAGDVDAATRMEADGTVVDASRAARRAKKEITALNREAMETIGDGAALRDLDAERTEVMRELNTEVDEIRQEKRGPTPGERLRRAAGVTMP